MKRFCLKLDECVSSLSSCITACKSSWITVHPMSFRRTRPCTEVPSSALKTDVPTSHNRFKMCGWSCSRLACASLRLQGFSPWTHTLTWVQRRSDHDRIFRLPCCLEDKRCEIWKWCPTKMRGGHIMDKGICERQRQNQLIQVCSQDIRNADEWKVRAGLF